MRVFCIVHSAIALVFGVALYMLFREGTYLHDILLPGRTLFADACFIGSSFLRYYFPDFLWAYSLFFALGTILVPSGKEWGLPALFTLGLGILWEWLQYHGLMRGTGDAVDILLYGAAIAVAEILVWRKKQC